MTKLLAQILVSIGCTAVIMFVLYHFGLPLGNLPGDFKSEKGGGFFFFPLATSLIASVVLTIVFNVLLRFWK